MEFRDMLDKVSQTVGRYVVEYMTEVSPVDLGLDRRCGPHFYVNEECIATMLRCDSNLQYYGGFEYVDKAYRREVGDYVFYLAEDDRVREHIYRFFATEETEEDED